MICTEFGAQPMSVFAWICIIVVLVTIWVAVHREDQVRAELARYLSPENENLRRGDLVACIRDLAQIAMSEQDNAETAERLLQQTRDDLRGGVTGVEDPLRVRLKDVVACDTEDGSFTYYHHVMDTCPMCAPFCPKGKSDEGPDPEL